LSSAPAARAELIEARDWYAARNAELADRFVAEIENVIGRVAAAPQQFSNT
jgi:plasmid stabilization system protein ParE